MSATQQQPRTNARQPIRNRPGGLALMIVSPVVAALAFAALISAVSHEGIIVMAAIGCLMLGWFGYDMGRRMRLPDGWTVMERDKRPPVIYLRPFSEDDRVTYSAPVGKRRGGVETSPESKGSASHEQALVRALGAIGPFIAIGKPGEMVAPDGAARIYVADNEWRETALMLLKKAAVVVLQPDATEGTWWELNAVAQHVDPRRLLMLVPDPTLRPLGYNRVRRITAQVLPVSLPDAPGPCNAAIFDDDARPIVFPLGKSPAKTLEPFFARLRTLKGPAA